MRRQVLWSWKRGGLGLPLRQLVSGVAWASLEPGRVAKYLTPEGCGCDMRSTANACGGGAPQGPSRPNPWSSQRTSGLTFGGLPPSRRSSRSRTASSPPHRKRTGVPPPLLALQVLQKQHDCRHLAPSGCSCLWVPGCLLLGLPHRETPRTALARAASRARGGSPGQRRALGAADHRRRPRGAASQLRAWLGTHTLVISWITYSSARACLPRPSGCVCLGVLLALAL